MAETVKAEDVKTEAPAKAEPKVETAAAAPAKPEQKIEAPAKPEAAASVRTEAKTKPARKPVRATRNRKPAPAKASPAPSIKKARPAARKAARAITADRGVETMTNKTKNVFEGFTAAEPLKAVFGDVNERTRAALERSTKVAEEIADLTRGNVEAVVASTKIAAKGVEGLSQDAADYSRKSFEEASSALKTFAEAKSATDLFRLQSDYARSAFDAAVAESARFSENMLKIAGDAVEPITSRYAVAAERAKRIAA